MSFEETVGHIARALSEAPVVDVGEWQAIQKVDLPMMQTIEVEDITVHAEIPESIADWQREVQPNLPWAEEHFQERVSGIPHNPPPSHVRWPFAQRANEQHTQDQKFSHTYPERFWSTKIHEYENSLPPQGIRYDFGDLDDLVSLLSVRPHTRQAYLPIWFPEDLTAARWHDQRVPCTLGYHFLRRGGRLKIVYYIRSCDFYRHFRDDVYMAGRLCQWVAERIGAKPGRLVMYISSMHVFAAERGRVESDAERLGATLTR